MRTVTVLILLLPCLENDLAITIENRVLLEQIDVATRMVGSKVRPAAFGAGEGRLQNGMGYALRDSASASRLLPFPCPSN
jgi:hypothetical protein